MMKQARGTAITKIHAYEVPEIPTESQPSPPSEPMTALIKPSQRRLHWVGSDRSGRKVAGKNNLEG